MKNLVVIPARYASTRLPGKPLIDIGGKPLLQWVYEAACASQRADAVIIATDDDRIQRVALSFGADAVMTDKALPSGTDRVFAAIQGRKGDFIINLQGDEPFIHPAMIDTLFVALEDRGVDMATLCCPLTDRHEYEDPNTVKVVFDSHGFALYFSRSPIPFRKNENWTRDAGNLFYKHIGIYGFSRSFLREFVRTPRSTLEEAESLEQLRALQNGYRIKVILTDYSGFGIDTEQDLIRARERLGRKI